jgi:hypothetical protein
MTAFDQELLDGTEEDLKVAQLAVRVHCSISWPEGDRCLNCHELHPCASFRWSTAALIAAGWSEAQIQALDLRTGAWS